MQYKFRGRISPAGCRVAVYLFDPCDSQEKSVVALKASIFVNGKCFKQIRKPAETQLEGYFEVSNRIKTSQKYDYARIIRSVGSTSGHNLTSQKGISIANGSYFGVVIDYDKEKDTYVVSCGAFMCNPAAYYFKDNYDISREILCTSVVCVNLKIQLTAEASSHTFLILRLKVESFPVQTFPLADTPTMLSRSQFASRWYSQPSHNDELNISSEKSSEITSQVESVWQEDQIPQFLRKSSNLSPSKTLTDDKLIPVFHSPINIQPSKKTVERLFPNVLTNSASTSTSQNVPNSVKPKSPGRRSSYSSASNEVSETSYQFEGNELAGLTAKDLEDLAPTLSVINKLYEERGVYEKPLVTV